MVEYFGGQLLKVLSASIFVTGMGMNPAHIGWVFLIFPLWDACLDPFMGWIPTIPAPNGDVFVGGLLTGAIFPLLWLGQPGWSDFAKLSYLIGIGLLFYTAFTIWVMPYKSMLPEMTPDTNERTSIMGHYSFYSKLAAITDPRIWSLTQLKILLSPGYTGMWLVIPSMLADVVDSEELRCGDRREGGFSSIFAWMNKASTFFAYPLAGYVVVWCGFVIAQRANQTPETFLNMRLCFGIVPSVFLIPAMLFLIRYPLSFARMGEIRTQLEARREKV